MGRTALRQAFGHRAVSNDESLQKKAVDDGATKSGERGRGH